MEGGVTAAHLLCLEPGFGRNRKERCLFAALNPVNRKLKVSAAGMFSFPRDRLLSSSWRTGV
jgi:hypothetical protein